MTPDAAVILFLRAVSTDSDRGPRAKNSLVSLLKHGSARG